MCFPAVTSRLVVKFKYSYLQCDTVTVHVSGNNSIFRNFVRNLKRGESMGMWKGGVGGG